MCRMATSTLVASTRSKERGRKNVRDTAKRVNPKLAPKWFEYLDEEAAPANIQYWIDLANESPKPINGFNFEIRHFRQVPPEDARWIVEQVSAILSSVARILPPAGYDPFDHQPMALFLAVLQTVPAGRVRACVVCDKYFLAQRKDRTACSPKCANVARQKRYRERWPEYEKNRKQNRAQKEKREKIRSERRLGEIKARSR